MQMKWIFLLWSQGGSKRCFQSKIRWGRSLYTMHQLRLASWTFYRLLQMFHCIAPTFRSVSLDKFIKRFKSMSCNMRVVLARFTRVYCCNPFDRCCTCTSHFYVAVSSSDAHWQPVIRHDFLKGCLSRPTHYQSLFLNFVDPSWRSIVTWPRLFKGWITLSAA